jgi:glyoxylase-like metal-dependent hydrolase (beta-lactamase superfamily II)
MKRLSNFRQTYVKFFALIIMFTSITLLSFKSNSIPSAKSNLRLQVITSSPAGFLVNSTLITGEKDAILIDAQFTLSDANNLVKIIQDSKKNLTTIYITHSHPDHYFGLVALKQAFPHVKIVALPSTVADMKNTWKVKVDTWKPAYGDKITTNPIIPDVLEGTTLKLEGHTLQITGNVQGDEANNSFVWIPSLKAVVCGDIVYNGVYPWTKETTPAQRLGWIATLNTIAALNPAIVVAGHQNPDLKNDATSLDFTKNYLTYYDSVLPASTSSAEFQGKVKAQFPGLLLDVILQLGADSAFSK